MQGRVRTVAALVLAAGFARRFGSDKRRACLTDGRPLLAASLAAPSALLEEIWVVLRSEDDPRELGVAPHARIIRSESAVLGMGHSLASGMHELFRCSQAQSVAILLGDMPWIRQETLESLVALASPEQIIVPSWKGQRGHPVIFGRKLWPALLELTGDTGARALLQANSSALKLVELNDPGIIMDIDTPEKLGQKAIL
jgi:molybdenum cofactor cytidylyltransferase